MKNLHILTTSIAAIAASTQSISAETLLVPEQYPDIQSAIDAASNGDTIDVGPGTYGRFQINSTGGPIELSIASRVGPSQTFIDEKQDLTNPIILISIDSEDIEATQISIQGFSIENISMTNDRMIVTNGYSNGNVSFSDMVFTNCRSQYTSKLVRGTFRNTVFQECRGRLSDEGSIFEECDFLSCECLEGSDGSAGILTENCDFSRCLFEQCKGSYLAKAPHNIEECAFNQNEFSIIVSADLSVSIKNSTFTQNNGHQIHKAVGGSPVYVIGCRIEDNFGPDFGTAIFHGSSTNTYVTDCIISGNQSLVSGAAVYRGSGEVILTSTTCCNNFPTNFQGSVNSSDPSNNISVDCEEEVSCCLPGSCLVLPTST